MTREELSSIWVAISHIIYWLVHYSSRKEGDRVKRMDGGVVILARYMFHFIRVYDTLII